MLGMRGLRRVEGWFGRGVIVAVALLVLAAGLCLFDGAGGHHEASGQHDDDTAQDLCFGMIVASLGIALLAGPLANGWVRPDRLRLVYSVSPHLPDPPPKFLSLS